LRSFRRSRTTRRIKTKPINSKKTKPINSKKTKPINSKKQKKRKNIFSFDIRKIHPFPIVSPISELPLIGRLLLKNRESFFNEMLIDKWVIKK